MNRKQKICLWIGITVIVLMGLFPPVLPVYQGHPIRPLLSGVQEIEYRFIVNSRGPILLSNLIVQWTVVSVITGGLIVIFKDKKPKDEQNNK